MTSMTSLRPTTPCATDGRASLARVFWLYGVAVGVAMAVLLAVLDGLAPAASQVAVVLLLVYQVAWYVALWRAAGRYAGPALWKWAARAVVFMPLIGFVIGVSLTAGAPPLKEPRADGMATPGAAGSMDRDGKPCTQITEFLGECKVQP